MSGFIHAYASMGWLQLVGARLVSTPDISISNICICVDIQTHLYEHTCLHICVYTHTCATCRASVVSTRDVHIPYIYICIHTHTGRASVVLTPTTRISNMYRCVDIHIHPYEMSGFICAYPPVYHYQCHYQCVLEYVYYYTYYM